QHMTGGWVNMTATSAMAQAGTDNVSWMTAADVRAALPARAYAEYTATTTLSTTSSIADSIPTTAQGTLILSASITLKSAPSRVRVRFQGNVVLATGNQAVVSALFQDAGANALCASAMQHSASGAADTVSHPHPINLEFEHVPGISGSTTYKIYVGP